MENKSKSEQRQSVLQLKKGRVKEISETLQLSANASSFKGGIKPRGRKLPQIIITDDDNKEVNQNCEKSTAAFVEEAKIFDNKISPRTQDHQTEKKLLLDDTSQDDNDFEAVNSKVEDFSANETFKDRGINEEFESKTILPSRAKREYFRIFENREEEDNEAVASTYFPFNENLPQSTNINNIIQELISLEKKCLGGLRIVIEEFAPEDNVRSSHIHENIQAMYEHMEKFIDSLIENSEDADRIAHVFINEELTLKKVYPLYAKNFAILKSCESINSSLGDLLSRPIKRLSHQLLILTSIKKELNKSFCSTKSIEFAIDIINEVSRQSNDILHIINVDNLDLSTKGLFIMNQKFWITKLKKFQGMVFLFEDEIIITQVSPKDNDRFNYVDSIKLKDLGLEKFGFEDNKFYLKDYSKQSNTYILEAENSTIKSEWTTKLQEILYKQAEQIKPENRNTNTETNTVHSKIKKDAKKNDNQKSKFYI